MPCNDDVKVAAEGTDAIRLTFSFNFRANIRVTNFAGSHSQFVACALEAEESSRRRLVEIEHGLLVKQCGADSWQATERFDFCAESGG